MKPTMWLFFAIFLSVSHFCGYGQTLTWHALAGEWYRPGYFWPLYVELPENFPGSADTCQISLDGYTVCVSGGVTRKAAQWFYLLPTRSAGTLSIRICGKNGEEKTAISQELSLRALSARDCFIGLYACATPPEFTPLPATSRLVTLTRVPDCATGLAMFDIVVCGASDFDAGESNAVCQWSAAGGQLVLAQPLSTHWQKICARLPRFSDDSPSSQGEWRLGTGSIHSGTITAQRVIGWDDHRHLPRSSHPAQESLVDWQASELESGWRGGTLSPLWLFCVAHVVVVLLCVYCWHDRRARLLMVSLAVVTTLSTVLLYRWLITCDVALNDSRVLYSQHVVGFPYVCHSEYRHVRHRRRQNAVLAFDAIPMPLTPPSAEQVLVRKNDALSPRFMVELPEMARDTVTLWHTQEWQATAAQLEVEVNGDAVWIYNATNEAWYYCLHLKAAGFKTLGHMLPGHTLRLDGKEKQRPLSLENLPYPWRERRFLLPWLTQLPRPVLIADDTAASEKIHVRWLGLPASKR